MRYRGRQHFQEMILQLQLVVLDKMRDALDHDHLVGDILVQDFLLLKSYDLLGLLLVAFLKCIAVTRFLVRNFIFNNSEIKTL